MSSQVFSGTIPALMTPCDADRRPDFDALVRTGRQLVDAGMSGLVYCGSMGDWPLLTLEQRMEGVERLANAGLPVIVGTGAQNTAQAAALARHAKTKGARGLMIIPRVLSRGSSTAAQRAHFAQRSRGGGRPAFGHLQQPLLWLPDPGGAVLRSAPGIPPSRRIQGVRRRGIVELRRGAHRRARGRSCAHGGRRHPGVPWRRQLRGLRRDHRHRQRSAP